LHYKIIAALVYPLGLKIQPCETEPGGRCSFFVTFRPRLASAEKNRKQQNFSRLISLITSSRAMITRFPTRLAKTGTKNCRSRACWHRVNY
jgi:hypothetical protein